MALFSSQLVGTIGLANRAGLWNESIAADLSVASSMLGGLFLLFENKWQLSSADTHMIPDGSVDKDADVP